MSDFHHQPLSKPGIALFATTLVFKFISLFKIESLSDVATWITIIAGALNIVLLIIKIIEKRKSKQ